MSDDEQLSQELASLHIQRETPRTAGRGWGRIIVVVILLGAAGVGGYFVLHRTENQLFAEEAEVGAVTLVSASQQDVTLVATGYVFSRKKATIAPKVNGRIAKLYVDEGDQVKEGQLIAELDVADAQAQLAQVKADIAAARAKVERARADLIDAETKQSREEKLLGSGAGTKAATDDAKAHTAANRAQLAAAEADVAAAQSRHQAASVSVDNTKIRAPFDGTVIRKLSEVGEVATIAGAGIFTIASLTDLEVQADVSESQLSKVKVGTPAEILLDAFPDRSFVAETKEIRQTVDRAKASVTVKVRFTGPAPGVLPDMAAKVSFRNKKLDDASQQKPKLVAPTDAIVDRAGRKVVLTFEDGRVHEFPVVAGGEVGSMVELTSGPVSGTRVVRHPSEKLKEGSAVKEKDAK